MTRLPLYAAATAALFFSSAFAQAQEYPVDTVTLVTHSSPGGGSDVFLRELSRHLSPYLGANVIVENVSGGSGASAMARLATAPADGSIFYATTPTFIYTSLLSDPQYKYTDLEPLVNFFIDPEVIYTAANSQFQSLEDVIQYARDGRGQWGAANPASLERQALEQLKAAAGVNAAVVTHEGGGDLMINVLNGTLQIGVGEVQEIQSQLEAGELRLLATFSGERLDAFPDLPTVAESGYDVVVRKFRGLAGPKGLPDDVIAAWEKATQAVLADEQYKASYEAGNLRAEFIPHDEYATFIEQFGSETAGFLKETGIIE
ncbi:tripartite tricarboxylate transporter substrate binding protein [Mesorhizobium microcysteis]|jgi:putative tricarboxylic transport membrane protein|uniref:Tripartite tricarboxylate transporter substrate binding protein n=1 Tax=Neoaquamicrobium microcysteis TaxID=2682781 RepID=A0A5D4GQZ1_9HYPH|nr:tripartite tricarboxylate transporter substrate binding protein [Mesorhizobium microcysteis]TYR30738.1 tripartite tricarboxylate transporter substrate binding protein [Mesorhizobium microcysteis]